MREVEVSRFVQATPAIVGRRLSPAEVLAAEGSFEVREVTEEAETTLVTVGGYGLELVFEFEERESGVEYRQIEGPLRTLRTTLTCDPENEGTRLAARSELEVGGPSVVDRVAAWKRRGELERALDALAEAE